MKVLRAAATLFLAVTISLSYASSRKKLINAAIQEVEEEFLTNKVVEQEAGGGTTASDLLSAFKRASREAIAQGEARIKFEKMIKKAERNILENEMQSKANTQEKAEEIAKELVHKPGSILTKEEIGMIARVTKCHNPESLINCDQGAKYRTPTGACNNIDHPNRGAHLTPFRRFIEPQYEDGFSQARGTMQGESSPIVQEGPFQPPNPSARIVSLSVIQDLPIDNNQQTHLLMQWGQFVDHGITFAPVFSDQCNTCSGTESDRCIPIRVPLSDPSFGMPDTSGMHDEKIICKPFPRSVPACDVTGIIKPREQVNELSAFIDASQVYGSTQKLFDTIRDKTTGLLRTGPHIPDNGKESLPVDTDRLVDCMNSTNCFLAGDKRVNEQTALLITHTIWMREHNRIVRFLTSNSRRTPEELFQTARAIVGAEIQKIIFKDYLPILLGKANMNKLISNYSSYQPHVDPSIPSAFATAAFRFGHSQVQPFFERLDETKHPILEPLQLKDAFFDPSKYRESHGTDPILRGLLQGHARQVDEFMTDALTNHLFETNNHPGMDLAALNIQRGRDHGLPPYLTWKRWAKRECGLSSEFKNDLTKIRLLQTYGSLEMVDLWVGGLAEASVPGGVLGATFACIIAKTFKAIRDGDRFFYENPTSGLFTEEQRQSLEKTSLSRIICDNSDGIHRIQENAFLVGEDVDCTSIDKVDLSLWSGAMSDDDTDHDDSDLLITEGLADDNDDDDVTTSSEEAIIDALENLLSTLKENMKQGAAEAKKETDKQLYNRLSKFLKSTV